MRHHLRRAKHIYETRGSKELIKTTLAYLPIEINNVVFRALHGSGTKVMEEDWDNLVILDACRYDMFENQIELEGDLQSRISLGSTSEEFLECNFGNSMFHDTVYINANAYVPRLGLDTDTFHAVIDLLGEWDDELETVLPETVVDAAIRANRDFPNKRLIIHFMQPHIPFIGEYGQRIQNSINERSVWKHLRSPSQSVNTKEVWKAYTENLSVVLNHVEYLLDNIDGKTVLSADHGNLVGERLWPVPTKRKYGHPYGVYAPTLVKVPWFVVDSSERREIDSNSPVERESQSSNVVEDRLQALGYK